MGEDVLVCLCDSQWQNLVCVWTKHLWTLALHSSFIRLIESSIHQCWEGEISWIWHSTDSPIVVKKNELCQRRGFMCNQWHITLFYFVWFEFLEPPKSEIRWISNIVRHLFISYLWDLKFLWFSLPWLKKIQTKLLIPCSFTFSISFPLPPLPFSSFCQAIWTLLPVLCVSGSQCISTMVLGLFASLTFCISFLRTYLTVFQDGTGPFCAPVSTPPFPAILSQLPTFSFLTLQLLFSSSPLLFPMMLLINLSMISNSSMAYFANLFVSPLQGTANSWVVTFCSFRCCWFPFCVITC